MPSDPKIAALEAEVARLRAVSREMTMATQIAEAMREDVERLELFIPPSKRGANVQRALASMRGRADAIAQCMSDAARTAIKEHDDADHR